MNVVVLTTVRLLGDGLAACLAQQPDMTVSAVVSDLSELRHALEAVTIDVALIDVTQGVEFYDVGAIATEWASVAFVALGLHEQRDEVIRCGHAGFAGYIARDASVDALRRTLSDAVSGHLACPPEISGGLLRALFRRDRRKVDLDPAPPLTRRESEVLRLVGDGLSNKEIASRLCLSVATVKHHVHHVLEKLNFTRRAEAMRRVRDAPWIAPVPSRAARQ